MYGLVYLFLYSRAAQSERGTVVGVCVCAVGVGDFCYFDFIM